MTGKSVYVTTDYREKQLQRALLQCSRPENANLVREALRLAGREDRIGSAPGCLVREAFGKGGRTQYTPRKNTARSGRSARKPSENRKKPSKIKDSRAVLTGGRKGSAQKGSRAKKKRG